jgi:hypothetical protein
LVNQLVRGHAPAELFPSQQPFPFHNRSEEIAVWTAERHRTTAL